MVVEFAIIGGVIGAFLVFRMGRKASLSRTDDVVHSVIGLVLGAKIGAVIGVISEVFKTSVN